MADTSSVNEKRIIYRESILKHLPTKVNPKYKVVDFILGYASEDYNTKGEGTGHFHPTWNFVTFSPEKVKQLKEKYPQVRVVLSIGGVGTQQPFNPAPAEKELWIANATKSIKEIILIYEDLIDGIDIHYDIIKSTPEDFSYSIGQLIKNLKNDPFLSIDVVSVAPTEETQLHYRKLVSKYHSDIKYVDYLFTPNQKFPKIEDVKEFYEELVAKYKPVSVLPGYLSPPLLGDKSKEAVIFLVKHKFAPGFFTYPSDLDSPVGPDPFLGDL